MLAHELMALLNSFREDLPEDTRDRLIYGDGNAEVKKIAVCWMAYRETILDAHAQGANVVVTHEPTFFADRDLDDELVQDLDVTAEKKALLDETGITVLRCHDAWDGFPAKGILVHWCRSLGLEPRDAEHRLFDVEPQSARTFAERVAAYTATVGQTTLRLYGNPDREVRNVCTWYGWKGPYGLCESGADLAITYDDDPAVQAWTGAEIANDTGYPIIVINHGVLEERGMVSLADHLRDLLHDIPVVHIAQGCNYVEIRSNA